MIKFTYHGEAVGKGRPRVSRRGNYVHTYTPEKTRNFEEALRFEFMASNCEPMPVYGRDVTLKARVLIGVSIPKSYSKKKQIHSSIEEARHRQHPESDIRCAERIRL